MNRIFRIYIGIFGGLGTIALISLLLFLQSVPRASAVVDSVDSLVVVKQKRILRVYHSQKFLKQYEISLGKNSIGPKSCEGDYRTPEGAYTIVLKKENSSYHKSLQISYPDSVDRAIAKSKQCDPGGLIMIHGIRNGLGFLGRLHLRLDWTQGCIALTNPEMDELFAATSVGAKVMILP